MSPSEKEEKHPIQELVQIVQRLRDPGGCPWDRSQTFESLTPYIIEEAYETIDAIEKKDFSSLKEELGDMLLHVVMISYMAEEEKKFNLDDVIKHISQKMITRHPHVFNKKENLSVDSVLENWETIKQKENPQKKMFDSIPKQLPALMQSLKLQKAASKHGFDWDNIADVEKKLEEEIEELKLAISNEEKAQEAGDVLFSIVNLLRKLQINSEESLQKTNKKFRNRIEFIENKLIKKKKIFKETNLTELEQYWQDSKKEYP